MERTLPEVKKSKNKLLMVVLGLWLVIVLGVIGFVVWFISRPDTLGASNDSGLPAMAKLENGSLANDFTLENLKGEKVRLSDLRGQVVVINLWATWCIPCVEEMPTFQEFQDQFPGFVMLGIDEEESREMVGTFLEDKGIKYQILLDYDAQVAASYKVFMLPTTFFVDQEGMIRYRHYGVMTPDQFAYYLRTLGVIQ